MLSRLAASTAVRSAITGICGARSASSACSSVDISKKEMDVNMAKSHRAQHVEFSYTSRDAIMYALGVGCKAETDLRYLCEMSDNFMPLPTYIVTPGLGANAIFRWPGIEFDLPRILHGEQYIELYEPLPAEAHLTSETRIVDILDKRSGALIMYEVVTSDRKTGRKLAMQQFGLFQVGSGNFGGSRTSEHERKGADIPKRSADKVVSDVTSVEQACLYRMGSLDMNPLHIDPESAKISGFTRPILHGLCSLGFATRHVLKAYANNDATLFKAVKCRFASVVLPGQTLETSMWDEGDRIVFEVKVKETGKVVVSNGYVIVHGKGKAIDVHQ